MDERETTLDIVNRPQDLLALEKKDPRQAEALWHGLTPEERLRAVLAARGVDRERLIILARDSLELTRAMAPDEFSRTVLELGPEDAGELLALSSDEQLTYLLDLTGWVKEEFAPTRYEAWLPLLLDGGAERVQRWLESTDLEVLALLFAHWMRVVKFLPSQEEQEPPDDLPEFTIDGLYHIEFRDPPAAGFVAQVLVLLKSEMEDLYREVMESMIWESASGMADDAARWRRGRMMDQGFPERLEALDLWAKPRPGEADWASLPRKADLGFNSDAPARSDAVLGLLKAEGAMLPALAGGLEPKAADALRAELAYVANCAVAALGAEPADPEAVDRAAAEGLGLVNLGLELLAQAQPEPAGAGQAAAILERVPLDALARQGSEAIRALNRRAWALVGEGWLKDLPTSLYLLDPPLDRWLAGLLAKRPRCFDHGLGQGREYRAFLGLADLAQAERFLSQAEFWGELLLELMGISRQELLALFEETVWPEDPREIKLTWVVGTWLARRALGLTGLAPLPAERLNEAVAALQAGLKGPLGEELAASCRALSDPAKAALAGDMLRGALEELSRLLKVLNPKGGLDPRFLGGLVVER
jgi:hypothetical protein